MSTFSGLHEARANTSLWTHTHTHTPILTAGPLVSSPTREPRDSRHTKMILPNLGFQRDGWHGKRAVVTLGKLHHAQRCFETKQQQREVQTGIWIPNLHMLTVGKPILFFN